MASLSFFHYLPRSSVLHRFDARMKLPAFAVSVAVVLHAALAGLVLETIIIGAAARASRLPVAEISRELLPFGVLLILMALTTASSTAGTSLVPGLPFTLQGLAAGGYLVWRLTLLVVLGSLLAGTTAVASIQASVAWYLRPFPFLRGGRIATMIGLTVTLIPLIFDSYREVSDAQTSRGAGSIRNPLRRIALLAFPLLLKTFRRADTLAAALESRSYCDERSYPAFAAGPQDWLIAAAVAATQGLVLLAGR